VHQAIDISGPISTDGAKVLTREALGFVGELEAQFGPVRTKLLEQRRQRDAEVASGRAYALLAETEAVRRGDWKVAPAPADLDRRHVEITGPVEPKMIINALGSGADAFMADFEDSLSPTWDNVVGGQAALIEATRRTLTYRSPEGKEYALMSPMENLDTTVSVQAWGFQLKVDDPADKRIDEFIKATRKNAGVEAASCSGGITETGTTPRDLQQTQQQQTGG